MLSRLFGGFSSPFLPRISMEKEIRCYQSVFAKYDAVDDRVGQNPFRIVGLSGNFIDSKELEDNVCSRISIGTNPDLNRLNSFSLLESPLHGYHVLSHHLRSYEMEKNRNYYEFMHSIFIKSTDWVDASQSLRDFVKLEISATVHHPYTKTEQLDNLNITLHPFKLDEQAKAVTDFLEGNERERFLLVLDAFLEFPSLNILNYPDDQEKKINLLQTIRFLLPPIVVHNFTFATQVYPDPHNNCFARIKFLESARSVDKSKTLVIDWSKINQPNVKLDRSFSELISEFEKKEKNGITELIEKIGTVGESAWIKKHTKTITEPLAFGLAARITSDIKGEIGEDQLIASFKTINEAISILKSFSYENKKITKYPKLVTFILNNKEINNSSVEQTARAVCSQGDSLGETFWNDALSGLTYTNEHSINFLRTCYKNCPSIAASLRNWLLKSLKEIAASSSQKAILFLEEWKKTKIWTADQLFDVYLAIFLIAPNLEVLHGIIKNCRLASSPADIYLKLLKDKECNSLLGKKYPFLFNIMRVFDNSSEGIDVADFEQLFKYFQGDPTIYSTIIYDLVQKSRYTAFPITFFELFLNQQIFPNRNFRWLFETFNENNVFTVLNATQRGCLAYLVYEEPSTEGLSYNDKEKRNFAYGFARLGYKTNIDMSILKLRQIYHIDNKNLLAALLDLLGEVKNDVNVSFLKNIITVHKELVTAEAITGVESLDTVVRIKDICGVSLYTTDLTLYFLREQTRDVCNASVSHLDDAIEEFLKTVEILRSLGCDEVLIASKVSDNVKQFMENSPRLVINLQSMLYRLKEKVSKENTQLYDFYFKIFFDGIVDLKTEVGSVSANIVSLEERLEKIALALQANELDRCLELLREGDVPSDEFFKLLKDIKWIPPYHFSDTFKFLDNLAQGRLEEHYAIVVQAYLLSESFDCHETFKVDLIVYLLQKTNLRLRFLRWVRLDQLPQSLQNYIHLEDFEKLIGQVHERLLKKRFYQRKNKNSITLQVLLEKLREKTLM